MTSYRADQVGEQVREEIMSIIRRDLKDPRIGFVSITAVRMSPDLRNARVRVSVLGNPEEKKASIAGLESATGMIRHELGKRLQNLKFSPNLRFEIDPSIEVVMITAHPDVISLTRSVQLGIFRCMAKPFELADLGPSWPAECRPVHAGAPDARN